MSAQRAHDHRLQCKKRIRSRIHGTALRPRLSVYRSLVQISAQLIDDESGKTLLIASSKEAKAPFTVAGAKQVGVLLAKKAKKIKITSVIFDRNAYKYHGRVKALADAAREGGLQF
ncbi:50S ribosomal protein L18 [Candidatus Peribacteria bacterium RIFCSPHIGHO2_02_FULL_49_16]|nr:MAG: 50S ribosomal protein L18 [Candidatus Peribacteria bacterium RIFCSPHIGHO2_01_FULL_49_38]OGJ59706.1 MAG: 50S ribosomal protein L18 [Candidatus Peribacteria bacterium RIFCSPHIGHO2_02_FULL_49_16]